MIPKHMMWVLDIVLFFLAMLIVAIAMACGQHDRPKTIHVPIADLSTKAIQVLLTGEKM